jgi:hypothetical protein
MSKCLCVCNCVDGSGIGYGAIFEGIWEAYACALIDALLVNFPSPLPFININGCEYLGGLSHHGNDKHQEWKSKNACQAIMSNGSIVNRIKGMCKTC